MNPTRNDLPAKSRSTTADLLNARLAELLDLRSQVKQAHWNIKGPGFHALHLLLDTVAEQLDEAADEVAERAVQLGAIAKGTLRMAAAVSSLPEYPADLTAQTRTIETVSDRVAAVARSIRGAIDLADEQHDADTADLFTQVSRMLDKNLWFLESHLVGDR